MGVPAHLSKHLDDITAAFKSDGFVVQDSCSKNGWIGVSATFPCTASGTVSKYKHAYYVEGDHRTMGWLLGFMAEPAVALMTSKFRTNVLAAFLDPALLGSPLFQKIEELVLRVIGNWVENMKGDIPSCFDDEINGMCEGCHAANPETKVNVEDLWEINAGQDALVAHAYTGELFAKVASANSFRVPLHCNAYAAPGEGGRHFFGRDYMFPTANVFQDVACMTIYRPEPSSGEKRYGFVSQTAPGFVGSIAGLNSAGVAMGVNMTASHLCNPHRPGLNQLLLNRHVIELAESARAAVDLVLDAPRGVTWIYPIADASGDAFVVEAGMRMGKSEKFPYLRSIPHYYRRHLPRRRYIERMQGKYGNKPPDRGAVVRSAGYSYPTDYITDWNEGLWNAFDRNVFQKLLDLIGDLVNVISAIFKGRTKSLCPSLRKMAMDFVRGLHYSPASFGERAYIVPLQGGRGCPGPWYFAPQRESRSDVIVATNDFISPEMRLTAMDAWTAILARDRLDDFQWRYDELNKELLDALDKHPEGLDENTAWSLINFLDPAGKFPSYYGTPGNPKVQVHGSVNLCELTERKMKSLFGYYGDDPITITLPRYL